MKKILHRKLVLYIVIILLLLPLAGLVTATPAPQGGRSGAPTVVSYQGQVMVGGSPYSGIGYFKIAVVDSAGTISYWSNDGSSSGGGEPTEGVALSVENGLFNVLLGDITLSNMTLLSADVFSDTDCTLRVWFSSDDTSYQHLIPDQRIAAVPYALQAQIAKDSDMLDGLDGSSYQLRVSNSCEVGNTIRSINADGSIECEAHDTRPGFSLSIADDAGSYYSSITIGVDGLPIISYRRGSYPYNLMIAHCKDLSCNTIDPLTSLDTIEVWYTSLVIGADGFPVISYFDKANEDLKVLHCGNLTCSEGNTITPVDSVYRVGSYNSITIGVDGLPIVSYEDIENKHMKVVHCGNSACSSGNIITTVDNENAVGHYTSIVIGVDGLPIISYRKWGYPSVLKIAHCLDTTCSTSNITTLDSTPGTGIGTSITIGIDGLPIISHYYNDNSGNWPLRVTHCGDIGCSSGTTTYYIDSIGGLQKPNSSISIGSDGLPIISYYDGTTEDLKVAHCADIACSKTNITTVDSLGNVGQLSSITIGTDGMPLISYYDQTNSDLKVAHCSNVFCIPYWRRR